MANSAWGIDVGNRALKAIKLIRDGDRLRVDDFEVIEHETVLSTAGDNKESLLQSALANFVQRHEVKGIPIGVSVSGQQSFARFIKLPPVESSKIPEIVRFEAIQQIPFPLDDVEWSYQLFQEPESPDVEVGIFAMKKDLVNRQISYFTGLHLNVQAVQMSPLAVYNAMYQDQRVGQTTMFMDAGAENTDLIIADGQTVWLRTLPIGGNNFTETLAKSFKLDFKKAEELKRNAATSKYAKQIFQAMRPVFADLVAEIQRSIGFYASVHREARIGRIIALGSTFQLPGLQKYLQQNLQLPVEKLDAFRAMPPADGRMAANFVEHSISLAAAYGLAVQALGDAKITSSLLPETIRRAKMWKEKTKWFATAAAIMVAGTALAAGSLYLEGIQYETQKPVQDENQRVLKVSADLAKTWTDKVQNEGEDDRTRIQNVQLLMEGRGLWPTLLGDILRAAPPNNIEQLKKVRREDRQQILIASLASQYVPDLGRALQKDPQGVWTEPLSRFIGREVTPTLDSAAILRGGEEAVRSDDYEVRTEEGVKEPSTAPAQRGFVLTIRGFSPNKDRAFVQRTFVPKLLARTLEAQLAKGEGYYIARADVVGEDVRKPKPVAAGDRRGDFGGFDFGRRPAGAIPEPMEDPNSDRTFPGESIVSDREFIVVAVVVLDPQAPKEVK